MATSKKRIRLTKAQRNGLANAASKGDPHARFLMDIADALPQRASVTVTAADLAGKGASASFALPEIPEDSVLLGLLFTNFTEFAMPGAARLLLNVSGSNSRHGPASMMADSMDITEPNPVYPISMGLFQVVASDDDFTVDITATSGTLSDVTSAGSLTVTLVYLVG